MIMLVDFDKTITSKDSTDELVKLYNLEGVFELQNRFRANEINIKTYLKEALKMLGKISKEEFYENMGKNVEIIPGFLEFIKKEYNYIIVSASSVENVKAILMKNNIEILENKIFSNKLIFTNEGVNVKFIHDGGCGYCGVCKKNILVEHKKKYGKVIYIGDGSSDICAARFADKVFAKKGEKLAKVFKNENREFIEFETFFDIISELEK